MRISRGEKLSTVSVVDSLAEQFVTWSLVSECDPRPQALMLPFMGTLRVRCMIHLAHSSPVALKLNQMLLGLQRCQTVRVRVS